MGEKISYSRLNKDELFDEIRLVNEKPVLRFIIVPRYKTSELSGDEWRINAQMQVMMPNDEWELIDNISSNLEAAARNAYSGVFTSHPDLHDIPIHFIEFMRKGRMLYRSDYEGSALRLLDVLGHLSLAIFSARQSGVTKLIKSYEECFQPSCKEKPVNTYKVVKFYCRQGHDSKPYRETHRRFCLRHGIRGDCGLEDADANYEILEGPGPKGAWGQYEDDVSPSAFGGMIEI